MDNKILNGKVVVLIGGLGLLGQKFCDAIIQNGGICVVGDLLQSNESSKIKRILEKYNENNFKYIPVNIIDKSSILNLINTVNLKYSKIDACVNTSYPRNEQWGQVLEEVKFCDFCENVNMHLGGYFLFSQQVCIYFKKQGFGNLINLASIYGCKNPRFDIYKDCQHNGKMMTSPAEYSIIKAGIIHFTKYLAQYYKKNNIRANCISPGGIMAGQSSKFINNYKQYCGNKGLLDPEDVSGVLLFLLSDLSKYVNGQNIIVDDSWSL